MVLPDVNKVISQIEHLYNQQFFSQDTLQVPVCITCDSICPKPNQFFLSCEEIVENKKLLKPQRKLPATLECYYKYFGHGAVPSTLNICFFHQEDVTVRKKKHFLSANHANIT